LHNDTKYDRMWLGFFLNPKRDEHEKHHDWVSYFVLLVSKHQHITVEEIKTKVTIVVKVG